MNKPLSLKCVGKTLFRVEVSYDHGPWRDEGSRFFEAIDAIRYMRWLQGAPGDHITGLCRWRVV